MYNRMIGFSVCLFLTMLMVNLGAAAPASPTSPQPATMVEDGLNHLFQHARDAFNAGNIEAAVAAIHDAGMLLQTEADQAVTETTRQNLLTAKQALDVVAADITKGGIKDEADLKTVFAYTHYLLVQHFQQKAQASWASKDLAQAGQDLRATADHLEYAMQWSGAKVEAATTAAIQKTRQLADQLVAGSGYVLDQFGQAYEAVGQEIEKLGKHVTPVKTSSPPKT